jgi:hypothetical protein
MHNAHARHPTSAHHARTCLGATRGGSTSPLSSLCVITITPSVRVVSPQLFCHACCFVFSSVSNSMPNILLKFWPRQWEVAPWMPRPVSGMNACFVSRGGCVLLE